MESLADEFFGLAKDARYEGYTLPSGRKVYVGELTGLDWVTWRLAVQEAREKSDDGKDRYADARLIQISVEDEKHNLVFHPGDEAKIMKMPQRHLKALLDLIDKVNASESFDAAKKNSETQTDQASSSGSSETSDSQEASAA